MKKTKTLEPPAPLVIPLGRLRMILAWQEERKALTDRVKDLEAQIKEESAPVIAQLEAGAVPEVGALASIKVDERRNIKWKEEFIRVCGESEAQKLHEKCAPTITKSLVITLQAKP